MLWNYNGDNNSNDDDDDDSDDDDDNGDDDDNDDNGNDADHADESDTTIILWHFLYSLILNLNIIFCLYYARCSITTGSLFVGGFSSRNWVANVNTNKLRHR